MGIQNNLIIHVSARESTTKLFVVVYIVNALLYCIRLIKPVI